MLVYFILATSFFTFSTPSLDSHFRHYEEIFPHDIKVRHKRDIKNPDKITKLVQFDILGNNFQIHLFPDSTILSPRFEVHLVDAVGKKFPTTVNRDGIYAGHEKDNVENKVKAVQHDDLWYFYISRPDDVFVIEPLSRLDPLTSSKQLIAYKSSDIVSNRTKNHLNEDVPFCRATRNMFPVEKETSTRKRAKKGESKPYPKRFTNSKMAEFDGLGSDGLKSRQRRNPIIADTCDIFVVVDYMTYKGIGKRSTQAIIKWIAHLMQNVDELFRNSGLSLEGTTFGVQLVGIYIHKEFTKVSQGRVHYNMEHNTMNDADTIMAFMNFPWHQQFCLAHLVTQRHFGDVLGVATIANVKWDDANGICMNDLSQTSSTARNVGMTTPVSGNGYPLSTFDYTITMSHEIGHNFGAEHDDRGPPCSPSSAEGGKYLMYPYSGALNGENARKFSPDCSLPRLREVLKAKASKCFRSKDGQKEICGDGLLSDIEDCDSGMNASQCCTKECTFSSGAVCSPNHHPCCTNNCQLAPDTQICYNDLGNECTEISTCDGVEIKTCPIPSPQPNGSPCGENGTCWNGNCLSFCENLGRLQNPPREMRSCNCEESPEAMCQFCCRELADDGDDSCKKMGGAKSDGSPCLRGTCRSGICLSQDHHDLALGNVLAGVGGSGSKAPKHTFVSVLIVIVLSLMGVVAVGMIVVSKPKQKDEEVRKFSKEDEAAIEELRITLQEAIGHLNVSPDDDEDPSTLAIKDQLEKEKRRKMTEVPKKSKSKD